MPDEITIPTLVRYAIILNFFGVGILFPLHYPVREVLILGLWTWAFPSRVGYLSFALLPFFPSVRYGYYAFNLFCVMSTLGAAHSFSQWATYHHYLSDKLHRLTRTCLMISLVIAAWQACDGVAWMRVFPEMYAMGNGRGGGLQTEPSLLASPFVLYLGFSLWKYVQCGGETTDARKILSEVAVLCMATIAVTRSLTVVLAALCFLPGFVKSIMRLVVYSVGCAVVTIIVLGSRILSAFSNSGAFTYLITTAVGSWRNVPDIIILSNLKAFLLPQDPSGIRDRISTLATWWNIHFAWVENTYSTFSASASTVGIIVTAIVFGAWVWFGYRRISCAKNLQATWIMLFFADWFIFPKFEVCGWIGIGLLTSFALITEEVAAEPPAQDSVVTSTPMCQAEIIGSEGKSCA